MDMEDSRPEDQSVILLESDEEQEEQEEPEVIDLADDEDEEDDDSSNEGEVSGKTCPAEVTEEMVPPEGAIVEQVKLAANDTDDPDILVTFESHVKTSPPCNLPPKVPTFFSLITWNIDGLEEENLANRIKGVVEVLKKEEPDVVYLQEVIPPTFVYLEKHLPQYKFLAGNDRNYFTATLLKVSRVSYDHHVVLPFHNTVMSRNLLCIQAQIDTVKLSLLNTHLESMREYSAKRKEQMKICFDKMKSSPSSVTTIFGGDLNARDYEVDATKGPIILDLWEVCGGRPASCWTWNMAENTNKQIPSKPKCRFDRLYIKKSSLAHIIPDEFRLIGKEKVPGMPCFPSDHWGIFVRFKVL
ncbi:tyrosyl-DNA phosphodiesterase 2-like isoform X3 [Macrobrachium rosenbergii]|uniref:tyrosyl-DNA phosphodiesterase 2-like isoform X3 n=1 Tax=Macrobrachium rosenbergii TaxID=79674 RepID=UPI0034D6FF12